jgi:hypothetical protein
MPKHEHYDKLSALALIGEASASELNELKKHLDVCVDCRRDYRDFTEAVLPRLALHDGSIGGVPQSTGGHDAESIRSRFLQGAQAAGVTFTPQALDPGHGQVAKVATSVEEGRQVAIPAKRMPSKGIPGSAVAASLILAAGLVGYYTALVRTSATSSETAGPTNVRSLPRPTLAAVAPPSQTAAHDEQDIEQTRKIASLEQQSKDASAQLEQEQSKAASIESEEAALKRQIAAAALQGQTSQQTIADLRAQLDRSQEQANKLQDQANLNEASFVADEVRIKGLLDQVEEEKASLEHERAIRSAGHEVGDLMAERNLHIVDVYDTDGQGKTKPIFGRIFLTGNKRLVFYAYDLNESRLEHANYIYRVWGEKQGPGESAKALGVFNADDKMQKRWVFKYEDAKVLSEIDSVFVTFEPTAKSPDRPRGQKLMYAYLRGEINHP